MNIETLPGDKLSKQQVEQLRALDYLLYKHQLQMADEQTKSKSIVDDYNAFKKQYPAKMYKPKDLYWTILNSPDGIKGFVQSLYIDKYDANHIPGVFLDKSVRGKGNGVKLLAAAIAHIEKQHPNKHMLLTVLANNKPALALYKKFGFNVPVSHVLARGVK